MRWSEAVLSSGGFTKPTTLLNLRAVKLDLLSQSDDGPVACPVDSGHTRCPWTSRERSEASCLEGIPALGLLVGFFGLSFSLVFVFTHNTYRVRSGFPSFNVYSLNREDVKDKDWRGQYFLLPSS